MYSCYVAPTHCVLDILNHNTHRILSDSTHTLHLTYTRNCVGIATFYVIPIVSLVAILTASLLFSSRVTNHHKLFLGHWNLVISWGIKLTLFVSTNIVCIAVNQLCVLIYKSNFSIMQISILYLFILSYYILQMSARDDTAEFHCHVVAQLHYLFQLGFSRSQAQSYF